jgi:glycosyltransferase involved in cell wall biosynthesis
LRDSDAIMSNKPNQSRLTVAQDRLSASSYAPRAANGDANTRPASVLLVCHTYPPVLGGSEIEAQRVSSALIGRGYRVRVVCTGGGPMPRVRDWVDPLGVPVRIYAERWKGALRDFVFALRVAGILIRERNDYDVVYFLMQGLQLVTGLPIARILGKPVVMKISGTGVVPSMHGSFTGRLELAWLRRWARYVMILNESMRQEAIDYGLSAGQLLWMPNPVDTDEFAPISEIDRCALRERLGIPAAPPSVLYCGRLAPEKGLGLLLDAFSLAAKQVPECRLVLVGDGPSRTDLEAKVRTLNVERNVRFIGAVPPSEVPLWLKIADVFTLVSPSEGFSCAVAEAMSTGVACVVSDIPANRQLIRNEKEGSLTPVGDAHAIANAIVRLLRDPTLRALWGQAARSVIVHHYSTSHVVDRYERLFRAVLHGKTVDLMHAGCISTPGHRTGQIGEDLADEKPRPSWI